MDQALANNHEDRSLPAVCLSCGTTYITTAVPPTGTERVRTRHGWQVSCRKCNDHYGCPIVYPQQRIMHHRGITSLDPSKVDTIDKLVYLPGDTDESVFMLMQNIAANAELSPEDQERGLYYRRQGLAFDNTCRLLEEQFVKRENFVSPQPKYTAAKGSAKAQARSSGYASASGSASSSALNLPVPLERLQ